MNTVYYDFKYDKLILVTPIGKNVIFQTDIFWDIKSRTKKLEKQMKKHLVKISEL